MSDWLDFCCAVSRTSNATSWHFERPQYDTDSWRYWFRKMHLSILEKFGMLRSEIRNFRSICDGRIKYILIDRWDNGVLFTIFKRNKPTFHWSDMDSQSTYQSKLAFSTLPKNLHNSGNNTPIYAIPTVKSIIEHQSTHMDCSSIAMGHLVPEIWTFKQQQIVHLLDTSFERS